VGAQEDELHLSGTTKTLFFKGTGAGGPHVPQDKAAEKTTSLAEQGDLAGAQEKKGGSTTYGRKGRQLRRSTGASLGHAKRKLERQKPS